MEVAEGLEASFSLRVSALQKKAMASGTPPEFLAHSFEQPVTSQCEEDRDDPAEQIAKWEIEDIVISGCEENFKL